MKILVKYRFGSEQWVYALAWMAKHNSKGYTVARFTHYTIILH